MEGQGVIDWQLLPEAPPGQFEIHGAQNLYQDAAVWYAKPAYHNMIPFWWEQMIEPVPADWAHKIGYFSETATYKAEEAELHSVATWHCFLKHALEEGHSFLQTHHELPPIFLPELLWEQLWTLCGVSMDSLDDPNMLLGMYQSPSVQDRRITTMFQQWRDQGRNTRQKVDIVEHVKVTRKRPMPVAPPYLQVPFADAGYA